MQFRQQVSHESNVFVSKKVHRRRETVRVWKVKSFTSTAHPASSFLPILLGQQWPSRLRPKGYLKRFFSFRFHFTKKKNLHRRQWPWKCNAKNAIQMHHRNNLLTLIAFFRYSLIPLVLRSLSSSSYGSYRLISSPLLPLLLLLLSLTFFGEGTAV